MARDGGTVALRESRTGLLDRRYRALRVYWPTSSRLRRQPGRTAAPASRWA
jgi:hypothetical protein